MPQNAAGWRVGPPLFVPTSPTHAPAATAPAGAPPAAPRRHDRTVVGGLVRRAHSELVGVGFADKHSSVAPQVCRDCGLVRRNEIIEDMRARGGADAFGTEQILDGER